MKRPVLFFVSFVFAFAINSCVKDTGCKPKSPESELNQMQAFAATNGMATTKHSSGILYQVISEGSGDSPTANSGIVITYTGKFMNGSVFDEMQTPNHSQPWVLGDLIKGWSIALPLIKEGGRIQMIIPSSLAYGCAQNYSIPGNSILYFDVTLIEVK